MKLYATQADSSEKPAAAPVANKPLLHLAGLVISLGVLFLIVITLFIIIHAKNRAENIATTLDQPTVDAEFNPRKKVTYIQVEEGQDRSVVIENSGTTLPIITRYNYRAMTPKNYEIIGMAPWALTENFTTNINDPQMIAYLLNREEVARAFAKRPDVFPLLQDPQLLAALAQDNASLAKFFNKDPFAKVITNPEMLRSISNSRFMSLLLNSKAVKYYRNHPQEAANLINASPVLSALKRNPSIRQAVQENQYLRPIAKQLLSLPAPTTSLHPTAVHKSKK